MAPIPLESAPVQVVVGSIAALHAGFIKGLLHEGPLFVLPTDDRDGTLSAVEIILDVHVGLGPAVEGQYLEVTPFVVAEGLPALEILGQPAQVHLPVDGARAADDLALGDVDLALLVIDDPLQIPGDGRPDGLAFGGMSVPHWLRQLFRIRVVLACLQQEHRALRVFR